MLRSLSVTVKLRVAFILLATSVSVGQWLVTREWQWPYLIPPLIGIFLAELFSHEILMTLAKARKVMHQSLGVKSQKSENLMGMRKSLTQAVSRYSPTVKVEEILENHQEVAVALKQELRLNGQYSTGSYAIGRIWSKPNVSLRLGLAQDADLGYRSKLRLLKKSTEAALAELEQLEQNLIDRDKRTLAGIVRFQILMLQDRTFQYQIKKSLGIRDSFNDIIKVSFEEMAQNLSNSNPQQDRSADVRDLAQRLLDAAHRNGDENQGPGIDLSGRIVLAKTLMPTECLQYINQGAQGFVVQEGSEASHVQILLSSMNETSVSGFGSGELDFSDGTPVILDAQHSLMIVRPQEEEIEIYKDQMSVEVQHEKVEYEPSYIGNEPVEFKINLNLVSELEAARNAGSDGIGLFRSEMEFLLKRSLPDFDEQYTLYKKISDAFPPGKVVLRLMDSGGDKLGLYRQKEREENPSMGLRSIRFLLREPKILKTQMRAMIEALREKGGVILVPLISNYEEVVEVKRVYRLLLEECEVTPGHGIRLGMMVETPSMVTLFDKVLDDFDYFSIGSNDLVQYTMAADRNNSNVSEIYRKLSPAILRMIYQISSQSRAKQKEMSLCGELAHDERILPLLLGLGLRQFSVNSSFIPRLKQVIKELDLLECHALAKQALEANTESEIFELLNKEKEKVF